MNLGIDCIALPANFSGAAYFIINLTKNVLEAPRSFNVQLYCKKKQSYLFKNMLKSGDMLIEVDIKNRLQQLFFYEWRLSEILIEKKTNVFLATHYITPKENQNYKIISIFHDMGFVLHSENYPLVKQMYFSKMIPRFISRSHKIVTVSKNTFSELVLKIPDAKAKTRCIYPGIDHQRHIHLKSIVRFEKQSFILAVNAFEKRKNIPFIIEIFNHLKRKNIQQKLLLVGRPGNYLQKIKRAYEESPFKSSIFILTDVSSAELKWLYKEADLFINASLYEGFGFTPFEAVLQNCPAFLYSNKLIIELIGKHSYLMKTLKADIWADKIYSEMQKEYPGKLKESNLQQLTWEKCAAEYSDLIKKTWES